MKSLYYISIFALFLCILTGYSYAQNTVGTGAGAGMGDKDQLRIQDPATHEDGTPIPGTGNQVQNQNQVNTQNQGEDTQLNVQYQNTESSSFGDSKSVVARQHMSIVSQALGDLLSTGNTTTEIGKQISQIAKQQQGAQNQLEASLDDMSSRNRVMKYFFGPDQEAVESVKGLMEQNRVRIQLLEELKNQTKNEAESTKLQEIITAMNNQNVALQNQVRAEESALSAFGWLLKLFN